MLDLGRVGAGDLLYDLGSGDGRIVVTAALRGATAVGIEYVPELVGISRILADSAGVADRATFRSEDLFTTDFQAASVVTLYLGPEFNLRLRPRLLALEPGSRVVSHGFHMREWAPDSTVTLGESAGRATLFYWMVPADVDGFWFLDIEGARGLSLELAQRFQMLGGEVRRDGRALRIGSGRVEGGRFSFTTLASDLDPAYRFEGELVDGSLRGVVHGPPGWGPREWAAVPMAALVPVREVP